MVRRYEDYETDRDLADENDFPQAEELTLDPFDEQQYRERTTYDLINALQEYMSFSTMADLLKLIEDNV